MIQICEDRRDNINIVVQSKISSMTLKRNVEDTLDNLKPIAIALDDVQKNKCTISETVVVWKNLEMKKEFTKDKNEKKTSLDLIEEEKCMAFDFAKEIYSMSSLLPLIVKFQSKSLPFQELLFENELTSTYEWWRTFLSVEQLLTTKSSSASVEKVFSSFGLMHFKLRNKLGTEKASKLVFLFNAFNNHNQH
ncbi:hypothetical protein PR048_010215 [Dryococelus australis]|uniref:HAT C-terminal dimerisation domain-containing protein n=1 Tax=Dryococelus australis TaxID=614101 RepID=A0ABQ9I2Y5_9NEOP|nr:hypothetical protein PR048_010215 [Dryococelus australis]